MTRTKQGYIAHRRKTKIRSFTCEGNLRRTQSIFQ